MARLFVVLLLVSLSGAPAAQQITVPREKALGNFGQVFEENISIQPTRNGPGVVFAESVPQRPATGTRLRFRVVNRGELGMWSVVVSSSGRRWEYAPEADETEFWSDELPGGAPLVSIVSTIASPAVRLTIDRVAISVTPSVPKSITLPDERVKNWGSVQEPFKTMGRSVVRIRFVDDVRKKVFVCTGWLIFDNRHILTNEHCINTDTEMRSGLADVDFDQGTNPARSLRFRRLLLSDARLDFSLLELDQPLDRPALGFGGSVVASQNLVIIQHPAGLPKQLSEGGCSVAVASVAGISPDPTDFEHRCDTEGGSSGSPVFDRGTMKVIGLHHLGFLEGDKPVNRAVGITQVVAKIREKFPNFGIPGGN